MSNSMVECRLCPKQCRIAPGQAGDCRVRMNLDGKLTAVTYGIAAAAHVDPVEKKPFYHYYPGAKILSIATVGCNLHCKGCQNWQISQANPEEAGGFHLPPKDVAKVAKREKIPLVACTYTEPFVYYEYTMDTAIACKEHGVKTAIVSAGYANKEPVAALFKVIDTATIDLKSFDDAYYRKWCDGSLKPVLNTLVAAKEAGIWLEVSNLLVPGLTDSKEGLSDLVRWMVQNLGADTPIHFLRFMPHYQMKNLPPTPVSSLELAYKTAKDAGLKYVYIGNFRGHETESTLCHSCGHMVIERVGYQIRGVDMVSGRCPKCDTLIPGRF